MQTTKNELHENVGLLKSVLRRLHHYGENIDEPGNREFFEVTRQAAVDVIWNLEIMLREINPRELTSK
jgi:hypothetical protein